MWQAISSSKRKDWRKTMSMLSLSLSISWWWILKRAPWKFLPIQHSTVAVTLWAFNCVFVRCFSMHFPLTKISLLSVSSFSVLLWETIAHPRLLVLFQVWAYAEKVVYTTFGPWKKTVFYISLVSQDWSKNLAQKQKQNEAKMIMPGNRPSSRQINLQGVFLLVFPLKYRGNKKQLTYLIYSWPETSNKSFGKWIESVCITSS